MELCALQLIYNVCDSDFHNGIGISRFFLTIPIHTHKIKKLNFVGHFAVAETIMSAVFFLTVEMQQLVKSFYRQIYSTLLSSPCRGSATENTVVSLAWLMLWIQINTYCTVCAPSTPTVTALHCTAVPQIMS